MIRNPANTPYSRPIMFTSLEINALKEGASYIIRPVKPKPDEWMGVIKCKDYNDNKYDLLGSDAEKQLLAHCGYGTTGNTLHVCEDYIETGSGKLYKADCIKPDPSLVKWIPSSRMSKNLCRYTLQIQKVEIVRLCDLKERFVKDWMKYPSSEALIEDWDRKYCKQDFYSGDNPFVYLIKYKVIEKRG